MSQKLHRVLADPLLSYAHKCVYAVVAVADSTELSTAQIMERASCDRRMVVRALATLKNEGWLDFHYEHSKRAYVFDLLEPRTLETRKEPNA